MPSVIRVKPDFITRIYKYALVEFLNVNKNDLTFDKTYLDTNLIGEKEDYYLIG